MCCQLTLWLMENKALLFQQGNMAWFESTSMILTYTLGNNIVNWDNNFFLFLMICGYLLHGFDVNFRMLYLYCIRSCYRIRVTENHISQKICRRYGRQIHQFNNALKFSIFYRFHINLRGVLASNQTTGIIQSSLSATIELNVSPLRKQMRQGRYTLTFSNYLRVFTKR